VRVKHSTEVVVVIKPSIWPLDLNKAAQEAVDGLVEDWFDEYDDSQPMTVTVSIEGDFK